MARKKISDEQAVQAKPKTRIVEATTTQKWKQPITVPVDDAIELEPETEDIEEDEDSEFEEIEIESIPVRKSPTVMAKSKFKDALNFMGIGNKEIATLRIDRLVNYKDDGNESLRGAETSFVDKVNITPGEIKDEKHLVLLKRYGPGVYRLSLRHGSTNLGIWKETIDGPAAPPQTTRTEGEVYSIPQNGFYPTPQVAVPAPKSLKEQLSEAVELLTLVRKIDGRSEANTSQLAQPAPVPEDIQIASILMKDPDIKAKAIKGLLGTAGQETDYLQLLIENGDKLFHAAGQMLQGVIQSAVIGVEQLRGSKNGQAQAGAPAYQTSPNPHTNESMVSNPQGAFDQPITEAPPGSTLGTETPTPEDQALDFIIDQCAKKTPVKIAADRLFNVADEIREKAPGNAIDGYIEMFSETHTDLILQWLSTNVPGAQPVLDMEHSKDWIASLQEAVKTEINQGGEDEQNSN